MPKEFWFGPAGGTVFTGSAKILNVSSKSPLWKYYVSEFKKLAKDKTIKFGKTINGVEDFSISAYSTIFKDAKTIEAKSSRDTQGNVESF